MNSSLDPNTVQTPRLRSASALLQNTDNQINPSIVQINLIHYTPTSSPQVTENNVTKLLGSSTVQHHQDTHQKDNTKPSTSQGINVIVISNEVKSQFGNIIITKQEKFNFLYQIFPLSEHSRKEIGPLVKINHILTAHGAPRWLKLIEGDGNCYVRAISYTISGTEDFQDKVRETMCDYSKKRWGEGIFKKCQIWENQLYGLQKLKSWQQPKCFKGMSTHCLIINGFIIAIWDSPVKMLFTWITDM